MATIRKTPAGIFNVQIRLKGRIQASRNFKTKELATAWAEQQELKFKHEHPLFLDAGYAYCHEILDRRPSQRLSLNRIDRICLLAPMQKHMDEITLQDVNAFKQARLSEVSNSTCRDELMMIRRVFKWYIVEHHAKTGDMLDVGVEKEIIDKSGSWYSFDGERIGQGRENVKRFLADNPDISETIYTKLREKLGLAKAPDAEAPEEEKAE